VKLGTQVGLGPGHIVLDGDPAPPKGAQPPFRPMSVVAKWLAAVWPQRACAENGVSAVWIKTPLGSKVGLGPGHIVKVKESKVTRI